MYTNYLFGILCQVGHNVKPAPIYKTLNRNAYRDNPTGMIIPVRKSLSGKKKRQ